jgi:hypothetical protein
MARQDIVSDTVRDTTAKLKDAYTFKAQRDKAWNAIRGLYGKASAAKAVQAAESPKVAAPAKTTPKVAAKKKTAPRKRVAAKQ